MSAGEGDKRKVTTDALETLGTIITPAEKRDAIHLAVENVVAKDRLYPGEHVTASGEAAAAGSGGAVGIVDPFLTEPVRPGERFWLVVYPRQIHSLRHVWTHPAFPDTQEVAEVKEGTRAFTLVAAGQLRERAERSEKWLRDFCARSDCPGYEEVMGAIRGDLPNEGGEWYRSRYEFTDEFLHFNGSDAHASIPSEFWEHVENVLGHPPAHRPEFFSCSC